MTALSHKEKEDLHTVFASISDTKPARFPVWKPLKYFIYSSIRIRFKSKVKKALSYRK